MHYVQLPYMDSPVSTLDICQAHQQLEADYNVGGILRERPSNQRRNASTGVQLSRMKYRDVYRHVDICAEPDESDDPGDEDVRAIYIINVLKWGLPMDDALRAAAAHFFCDDFLNRFPTWSQK